MTTVRLDNLKKTKSTKAERTTSKLEQLFEKKWTAQVGFQDYPSSQVYFDFDYNGRFDFAWLDALVALEIQGGTFVRGAHVRGLGYAADCKKINLATLKGWRVFQATTDMLRTDQENGNILIIDQILQAINKKVDNGEAWVSRIRSLAIKETLSHKGFEIERQSATRYRLNDTIIREKSVREAWQSVHDSILYYPLSLDDIWMQKREFNKSHSKEI